MPKARNQSKRKSLTGGQTAEEAALSLGENRVPEYAEPKYAVGMITKLSEKLDKDKMCLTLDGALAQLGVARTTWAKCVESQRNNEEFKQGLELLDQMMVDRLMRLGINKSYSDRMALAILKNRHGFESMGEDHEKLPTVNIIINANSNGQDAETAAEFQRLRVIQAKDRVGAMPAPQLPDAPAAGTEGKFLELTNMADATNVGKLKGPAAKAIRSTREELGF